MCMVRGPGCEEWAEHTWLLLVSSGKRASWMEHESKPDLPFATGVSASYSHLYGKWTSEMGQLMNNEWILSVLR